MADPHDATAHVPTGSSFHTEDHDHDGTPTQKILAANSHESPSADTHHADIHTNAKHTDPEAPLYRLKSGLYYPVVAFGASSTPTLDELRVSWFPIVKTVTIDRIGVYVQAAVALSEVRLGIYRDDGNGYPGSLVLDAGTISAATTGFKEITISQQLTPDLYWIGGVGQVIVAAMTIGVSGSSSPIGLLPLAAAPSSSSANGSGGFLHAGVSGALPSTFTATVTNTSSVPRVFLRAV